MGRMVESAPPPRPQGQTISILRSNFQSSAAAGEISARLISMVSSSTRQSSFFMMFSSLKGN